MKVVRGGGGARVAEKGERQEVRGRDIWGEAEVWVGSGIGLGVLYGEGLG